jgi:hypothetical protein
MRLTPPSAVAVTATGAEEGILSRQSSCLDPVDGVGVLIFSRDGSTALALAH